MQKEINRVSQLLLGNARRNDAVTYKNGVTTTRKKNEEIEQEAYRYRDDRINITIRIYYVRLVVYLIQTNMFY